MSDIVERLRRDLWIDNEFNEVSDEAIIEIESLRQQLENMTERYNVRKELADYLNQQLASIKRPDFREMREMLRAMQAGELTVSRGIEILEMWSAGNWNDDMLPPVRQDLIEEDSMPVEIIDRLRQQLAGKDVEIEWLSRQNSSYSNLTKAQEYQITALRTRLYELKGADKTLDSERDANAILTEQLAATQAVNQQLREALAAMVSYAREEGKGLYIADEALALPQDTSALEAMLAKAGELMRERCAVECETHYNFSNALAAAIRALPGVTLEDIK